MVVLGLRCYTQPFSSCGAQAAHCVVTSLVEHGRQQLWHMGWATSRHVGSSRTRDRTHVPCTGRQILNHWATREVPAPSFNIKPWAQTFGFWGALCLYQLSQSLPSSIFLGLFHASPPSVCKYTWAVSRKLVRPSFSKTIT